MKFKLNFHERLIILGILPSKENFVTLRIIRKVSKDIGIAEEEFKELDIKQIPPTPENPSGNLKWNLEKGAIEKEFEIGEIATQLIVTALENLDKLKILTQEHFSVYEKFITNGISS